MFIRGVGEQVDAPRPTFSPDSCNNTKCPKDAQFSPTSHYLSGSHTDTARPKDAFYYDKPDLNFLLSLNYVLSLNLCFIILATSGLMYRVTEFYNFYHLDLTHGLSRLLSEVRLNEC